MIYAEHTNEGANGPKEFAIQGLDALDVSIIQTLFVQRHIEAQSLMHRSIANGSDEITIRCKRDTVQHWADRVNGLEYAKPVING